MGFMTVRHTALAALVMTIWGANFVVIEHGLVGVPPLLFVALRFAVVLLALPFVPRPDVPWRHLALVGLFVSVGQFGFLYSSIAAGMPAGLASLVLQLQAVVTVVLAILLLGERPVAAQVVGIGLGVVGLCIVAVGRGGHIPLAAVLLTVLAAGSWGAGNVVVRRLGIRSGLGVTVWSAAVVPWPLLALSLVIDGPAVVGHAVTHLSLASWASTAYTAVLASLVGYTIWYALLARYPAATVAPWTLLVPPVGIATAWLVDGERPTGLAAAGGLVLVVGVALTALGPSLAARRSARRSTRRPSDRIGEPPDGQSAADPAAAAVR